MKKTFREGFLFVCLLCKALCGTTDRQNPPKRMLKLESNSPEGKAAAREAWGACLWQLHPEQSDREVLGQNRLYGDLLFGLLGLLKQRWEMLGGGFHPETLIGRK